MRELSGSDAVVLYVLPVVASLLALFSPVPAEPPRTSRVQSNAKSRVGSTLHTVHRVALVKSFRQPRACIVNCSLEQAGGSFAR